MFIINIFREKAEQQLRDIGIDAMVEESKEGFGDFTLPCFQFAKHMKKSPALIAKELQDKLERCEYFDKIEAVGPYLNFHISQSKLAEMTLSAVFNGSLFSFEKKEKIILEHTSANPTGPIHVGRARNPIIGDTMARILRAYGHDVDVQYFVNDAGKQVATLLWGIRNLPATQQSEKCDHVFVRNYQEASKLAQEDNEVDNSIRELMKSYESGDPELTEFARDKIKCMLSGITESLEKLNVHIDTFVWESSLISLAKDLANKLGEYVEEENGAYYINLRKIGANLQKDKFFLYRKDGTTLYFLRDIAYHIKKSERAKYLIDVMGEDHKLHFSALKEVLNLITDELKLRALFYSFVSLPEGKMSTRAGTVVYLDDLIDEGFKKALSIIRERGYEKQDMKKIAKAVSVSAIRFSMLNVQEEKPIVFRWDKALSFEGESAPFIMYTYARASSILRKAEWNGSYDPSLLRHINEYRLIKLISKYPNIINNAADSLSPYVVAKYTYELAMQFNQFYRDCPVLNTEHTLKNARLALVTAFKSTMQNLMNILGFKIIEKM